MNTRLVKFEQLIAWVRNMTGQHTGGSSAEELVRELADDLHAKSTSSPELRKQHEERIHHHRTGGLDV